MENFMTVSGLSLCGRWCDHVTLHHCPCRQSGSHCLLNVSDLPTKETLSSTPAVGAAFSHRRKSMCC
jgi:hypothetical protein